MAADLLGASPGKSLLALAAEAEGNPLLLVELWLGCRRRSAFRSTRAVLSWCPVNCHDGCVASCTAGWRAEPGRPRALEVGAVLVTSSQVDHVAALLGETPAGLLSGIESALEAGSGRCPGCAGVPPGTGVAGDPGWRAGAVRYALHRQVGEFLLQPARRRPMRLLT